MSFIGLDIGSHSLKAVQLEKRSGGKFELMAVGSMRLASKSYFSDSDSDLANFTNEIKNFWRTNDLKIKDVAISLPEDQTYSRFLVLPNVTEAELESALRWEAEQYVPIALDEAILSHQIVNEITEGTMKKIQVFLVAAPKRLVGKITDLLKAAGLNLISVETEMISLARCFSATVKGAAVIVDFGMKATDIAIVRGSQLLFSKSIPTGGEALTRAIEVAFGVTSQQAEEYKKAYGFDKSKAGGKVYQVLSPLGSMMISEIGKVMEYYRLEIDTNNPVSQVILSGGGSLVPEMVTFIASGIKAEVQRGDPFLSIANNAELLARMRPEDRYLFGVAIGLAMKDI